MNYTTTGTIHRILPIREISDKFSVQEFVLRVDEQVKENTYTQKIKFQTANKRMEQLGNLSEGDQVEVHFNIRGRDYTKGDQVNYFNTLDAWKIEPVNMEAGEVGSSRNDEGDLPF